MTITRSISDRSSRFDAALANWRAYALSLVLLALVLVPALVITPYAMGALMSASEKVERVEAQAAARDAELRRHFGGEG